MLVVLVTAACTTADKNKLNGMENEPKNAEEAVAMHEELMARENAILTENTKLWEQVFAAADKGMTLQEDGKTTVIFFSKPLTPSRNSLRRTSLNCSRVKRRKSGILKIS